MRKGERTIGTGRIGGGVMITMIKGGKTYNISYSKPKFKKGKPLFPYWQIFKMDVPALYKFLKYILLEYYGEVCSNSTNDYLYAKGEIPILLVAHMDIVHKKLPRVEHDHEKNTLWSKTGLGADDRAGVAAILKIIEDGYRPYVLFTDEEESGCVGASIAIKKLPVPDIKYIIELDRRGSNDAVYYDNDNPDFEKYVNSFGFTTATGSFSDISELCPSWGISGVNLSIGYYNAHSLLEYLKIDEWEATVEKVKRMLDSPPAEMFEYIEKPQVLHTAKTPLDDDLKVAVDKIGVSVDIPLSDFVHHFGGDTAAWRLLFETYGEYLSTEIYHRIIDTVFEEIYDIGSYDGWL